MSNSFTVLEEVCRKLRQKSVTLETLILASNRKLTELDPVSELWLHYSPISCTDYEDHYEDGEKCGRLREVTLLGCRQVGESWELAIKQGDQTNDFQLFNSRSPESLLSQAKGLQFEAMKLLPELVAAIAEQHQDLVNGVEEVEGIIPSSEST